MAGVKLGKRGRADTDDGSTVKTRGSKRFHIAQDNGHCSSLTSAATSNGDGSMQLDDSENTPPETPSAASAFAPCVFSGAIKQQKLAISPALVPQTPRRGHASPSKTPFTPKHRVTITGKSLTPRTPRTPSTSSAVTKSVYNEARKIFTRGADPGELVGRDAERNELQNFIGSHVASRTGGALYVSGPPGTGKTALVSEMFRAFETSEAVHCVSINCMSIKSGLDLFVQAAVGLDDYSSMSGEGAKKAFKGACFNKTTRLSCLIVLDEVDQLVKVELSTLYELFEWALAPNSKLILVGIANALDLTDRFLPRLKARNLKPNLLPFLPYTVAEVTKVLTARCRSLLTGNSSSVAAGFTPFLHPAAIQLIAKKVASQTGDLRKSFDIARRAIDLIELETKESLIDKAARNSPAKKPLTENLNLSSPQSNIELSPNTPSKTTNDCGTLLSQLTVETAPQATPAHVARVTAAVFGNTVLQRFKSLNLQQKAILCTLVMLEINNRNTACIPSPQTPEKSTPRTPSFKETRSMAPSMRDLLDGYTCLCKQDNILHALSSTEFRDIVANLETASLVSPADGKAGSLAMYATPQGKKGRTGIGAFGGARGDERKISACIGLKDLESGIEGIGSDILKNILRRVSC